MNGRLGQNRPRHNRSRPRRNRFRQQYQSQSCNRFLSNPAAPNRVLNRKSSGS